MHRYVQQFIVTILLCSGLLQSCHSPYLGTMAQELTSSRPTAAKYKGRPRACINRVRVLRPALRLDKQWIGGRPSFPSTLLCHCEPSSERPKICIGTSSFAELLLEGDVFVDKSLFIKEFLDECNEVTSITRPRRWGKSLNMDMLKRFLAIEVDAAGRQIPQEQSTNRKLFVGGEVELDTGETRLLKPLKISNYAEPMQHQGEYPVISLDFKDVKGSSYQEIVEALKKKVTFLYREHAYLEQGIQDVERIRRIEDYDQQKLSKYLEGEFDGIDLKYGLRFLSKLMHNHFRRPVYILIDEYDAPIAHAYLTWKDNAKDASRVFKLLESFLGPALKGNEYLKRGLLTGVFKICPTTIFSSGLNSICHYTLFNKTFSPFYGFTQSELDELLRKVPISASPSEIQRWYKGYTFGDQEVYNPWSIMCCLSNGGKLARYWFEREENQLANLMPYSKINQYNLQQLVSGNRFSLPVPNRVDFEDILGFGDLYELLVFGGYLNAVPPIPGILHDYDISIPTYEMRHFYEQLLLSWVYEKLHIDESTYKKLAKLLSAGKVGTFTETMHEVLSQSSNLSSLDYWQAHTIHKGFMLGLLINLVGHYDLELETYQHNTLLIPTVDLGDQALVMDYKLGKEVAELAPLAETGLAMLVDKGYSAQAKSYSHVRRLLQVCLAFCGQEMVLKYEQVDLQ